MHQNHSGEVMTSALTALASENNQKYTGELRTTWLLRVVNRRLCLAAHSISV